MKKNLNRIFCFKHFHILMFVYFLILSSLFGLSTGFTQTQQPNYLFRIHLKPGDKIEGTLNGNLKIALDLQGKKETENLYFEKSVSTILSERKDELFVFENTIKLLKATVDNKDQTEAMRIKSDGTISNEVNDRWMLKEDMKALNEGTNNMSYFKKFKSDSENQIIFNLFPMNIGDSLKNGLGKNVLIGSMTALLSFNKQPEDMSGGVVLRSIEEKSGYKCGLFDIDVTEKYNGDGTCNNFEYYLIVNTRLSGKAWISLDYGFVLEYEQNLQQHIIASKQGQNAIIDVTSNNISRNKLIKKN